jgi:glycerol kinase
VLLFTWKKQQGYLICKKNEIKEVVYRKVSKSGLKIKKYFTTQTLEWDFHEILQFFKV